MAEREKYYIGLNGQTFEVSKELYEAYYKGQRKEKYFTHDLKQEHIKVDKETGGIIVISSREDSYERLLEAEKQFAEEAENVEDVAVRAVIRSTVCCAFTYFSEIHGKWNRKRRR